MKKTMTAAELKAWQEENRYTNIALARSLGVHVTAVYRWRRGYEIPTATIMAIRSLTTPRAGGWALPDTAPRERGEVFLGDFGGRAPLLTMWDDFLGMWCCAKVAYDNKETYYESHYMAQKKLRRWLPLPGMG